MFFYDQTFENPTVKDILTRVVHLLDESGQNSSEFIEYYGETVTMAEIILLVTSLAGVRGRDLESALEDVFKKRRQEYIEQRS